MAECGAEYAEYHPVAVRELRDPEPTAGAGPGWRQAGVPVAGGDPGQAGAAGEGGHGPFYRTDVLHGADGGDLLQ